MELAVLITNHCDYDLQGQQHRLITREYRRPSAATEVGLRKPLPPSGFIIILADLIYLTREECSETVVVAFESLSCV